MPDPTNPFLPIPQIPFPAVARKTNEPAYTAFPVEWDNQGNYFEVIPENFTTKINEENAGVKINQKEVEQPLISVPIEDMTKVPKDVIETPGLKSFYGKLTEPDSNPFVGIKGLSNNENQTIDYTPFLSPEERLIAMAPEGPKGVTVAEAAMPKVIMNPFIANVSGPKITSINPIPSENTGKDSKYDIAEKYYAGKAGLDAVALFNNMIQPEPPSLQVKLPHYERMKLNPEPYDTMRSEMRDQGTQAYRMQRENVSQASDLMKGLAAVTSGIQQGLMQVGMQQAGAEQQMQQANQQIASQETDQQTQMLNQEAAANYQIQQQAQMVKDSMISKQLESLNNTAGAFTKYSLMKEHTERQDKMNKLASEINNELQAALVENELIDNALGSEDFKTYYSSLKSEELKKIREGLLSDEKYKALSEYYGGVAPDYSRWVMMQDSPEYQRKLQHIAGAKEFEKKYPTAPKKEDYTSDIDWQNAEREYKNQEAIYNKIKSDPMYSAIELESQYWKEALGKFNESDLKKSAAENYLSSRGLTSQKELFGRIKSITDRTRQFEG